MISQASAARRCSAFAEAGQQWGCRQCHALGGQGLPALPGIPDAACSVCWLALAVLNSHANGN